MKNILFVCVHNAWRCQMAEAFFNQMVNGKAEGFSANIVPSEDWKLEDPVGKPIYRRNRSQKGMKRQLGNEAKSRE